MYHRQAVLPLFYQQPLHLRLGFHALKLSDDPRTPLEVVEVWAEDKRPGNPASRCTWCDTKLSCSKNWVAAKGFEDENDDEENGECEEAEEVEETSDDRDGVDAALVWVRKELDTEEEEGV
eukprot:CAMPEP_0175106382 /NCGR_PEP_ID=MMETSP0086_2-20121207/11159_1 /TAXON_ID=136419 /ORGANISM="Unknown Unknown, Strain D1" /LENGTH=120 /DNA_ID=CAMNT_0016382693 /DNA_START=142 /DNA_END=506 /DNA_ORIENTATION=+